MAEIARTDLYITKGSDFSRTFKRYSESFFNFRGNYSKLVAYEVDDIVIYKNVVYKCILDTTAGILPTNATYFEAPAAYDYSSSTIEAHIRTDYDEEDATVEFTVAFITDGTDGQFVISLTAAQTEALDFDKAVYDIEITEAGTVRKEAAGTVNLQDEATK